MKSTLSLSAASVALMIAVIALSACGTERNAPESSRVKPVAIHAAAISPGLGGGQQQAAMQGQGSFDEQAPWDIVNFTDPRDSSTYQIVDGRAIVSFKDFPQLPDMGSTYFTTQRSPTDPYYGTCTYPSSELDIPAVAGFVAAENLQVYSDWTATGGIAVLLPEGTSVSDAITNWPQQYPDLIAQVDPDAVARNTDPLPFPNDFHYPDEWGINDTQLLGNPNYSPYNIHMGSLWQGTAANYGSSSTVVAVLDSGVDYNVLDLQPNSTSRGCNTGDQLASTQCNLRAQDGGGGPWLWAKNLPENNDPANDGHNIGHGTCVAGIISARPNDDLAYVNNDGHNIAGVAWNPLYLPVAMKFDRVFSTSTILNSYTLLGCVSGVYNKGSYAQLQSVTIPWYNLRVVNCSFEEGYGSTENMQEYRHMYFLSRYMLFVCGAGNDARSDRSAWPAHNTNCLPVAAYDSYGYRSIWNDDPQFPVQSSNYAPDTLIAAPGGGYDHGEGHNYWTDIYTTDMAGSILGLPSGHYGFTEWSYNYHFRGTSAAAPFVAGVAAIYLSKNPNASILGVKNRITSAAYSLQLPDPSFNSPTHAIRALQANLVLQ